MGIIHIETFIFAVVIFALTPGIDTIYILNRAIIQGKKAGLYSSLGILSGVLVHITFAAFGLSLILSKSATAFSIVKYAGAAYLIYLGLVKIFSKHSISAFSNDLGKKNTMLRIYFSGIITDVFNPKVALFFLAFFPQFIDVAHSNNPAPFLSLGAVYIAIDLVWCILLTMGASLFTAKIKNIKSIGTWMNKVSGSVFILLGIKIAISEK